MASCSKCDECFCFVCVTGQDGEAGHLVAVNEFGGFAPYRAGDPLDDCKLLCERCYDEAGLVYDEAGYATIRFEVAARDAAFERRRAEAATMAASHALRQVDLFPRFICTLGELARSATRLAASLARSARAAEDVAEGLLEAEHAAWRAVAPHLRSAEWRSVFGTVISCRMRPRSVFYEDDADVLEALEQTE